MSVKFSPFGNSQISDASGNPAVGWTIGTYTAGSSARLATYTDATGSTAQTADIVLNALGLPTNGQIWLTAGSSYKFIVKNASGVTQFTVDNIAGVNDVGAATISQWQSSNLTPTFVSTTSFTVPGDQTSELHIKRRLQFTTGAGTVYGTILTTAFTTLTTVTMTMDAAQVLDSGLTVINLSLLRADHSALPGVSAFAQTYLDDADAVTTRATLGANASSKVKGLIGAPTAATPLTKYDLSADEVVLRNSTGGTITRYLTGTITNDFGLAGSAANGRDQAAAFTASSWIYVYFIWNGTTLATISSTAVPTTGPTLPTGYTHWCYATTILWSAVSNITPVFTRGSWLEFDVASDFAGFGFNILSQGRQTVMTAVSFAASVPSNALLVKLNLSLSVTHNVVGATFLATLRSTGSTIAGKKAIYLTITATTFNFQTSTAVEMPLGASQQIDYMINAAPSTGTSGLFIDLLGFKIPNGDS